MECKLCNHQDSPYTFSNTGNKYCESCLYNSDEYKQWLFQYNIGDLSHEHKELGKTNVYPNETHDKYREDTLWELNQI